MRGIRYTAISFFAMICAPAAKRPTFRKGMRGGEVMSATRTAQMITLTRPAKLAVCARRANTVCGGAAASDHGASKC